jgi:hypothetical protein
MLVVKWAGVLAFWVALATVMGFTFIEFVMIVGGGNAIR